jgi:glycosyltransferase involved in cell wall biosynthesis
MPGSLLYIAYAYPPCGGAGVQRTAKFVRYLPDFGWRPTVLTVDPSCYGLKDDSNLADTPDGVDVIRTFHVDPLSRLAGSATPAAAPNGGAPPGQPATREARGARSVLRTVAKRGYLTVDEALLVPDPAILWYPRAVAAGVAAHRRRRFDVIFATGEPYSDFLMAASVSRLTGVPFALDMRDPWTLVPYRSETRSALRQRMESWQERRVLAGCRACVFANRASDAYAARFPQWAAKFEYIPNGYDSADFESVDPVRFDRFTIVHNGTFLPGYRTADTFLRAIRRLLDARPDLASRIQVMFVGKIGEERQLVGELGLGEVVRQTGYVPHRESIGYLLGADQLLLVGGNHAWEETGKIYEYFAADKPILGLVHPDGVAAELLRRYGASRVLDRGDVEGTALAIEDAMTAGSAAGGDRAWAAGFERRELTRRLAAVLDAAASGRTVDEG